MITSRQNRHIKYLISLLHSSIFRKQQQEYVIEGIRLLQSAPLQTINGLFVPKSRINNPEIQLIISQMNTEQVFYITDQLANQVSNFTSGGDILAIVGIPKQLPTTYIKEDCILLDRIQDPGNLGTIIRSAVAGGVRHVLLSNGSADVYMPKVVRASMGAHFQVQLYSDVDLVNFMREYPYNVLVTQLSKNSKNLYEVDLTGINAWVVGNEGVGVAINFDVMNRINISEVHIPMIGHVDSLNVAMATSICVFEQSRQRLYRNLE